MKKASIGKHFGYIMKFGIPVAVVASTFAMGYSCDKGICSLPKAEYKVSAMEYVYDVVEIGGVKCIPKSNLETYLLMGTDIRGKMSEYAEHEYNGTGQCDFIQLLVIDKTYDTYATLAIDRNTLQEFDVYDEETMEKEEDTFTAPICLAYAYGNDGTELSSENMKKAVSDLLYGQKITGSLALGMDSITVINHKLGGVTVKIDEDFDLSEKYPRLKAGEEVLLTDEEAYGYVHDRMDVADGTNINRMGRQKQYLEAVRPVLYEKCREQEDYPLELYEELSDVMYTDITQKQISKIAKAVLKNENLGEFTIEGETVLDEGYDWEIFHPDPESLAEVVIELFYDRVEE